MKKIFTILLTLFCSVVLFQGMALNRVVTKDEAFSLVKKEFANDAGLDYYLVQDGNASFWTFFVDAEPMKGWEHNCYTVRVPRVIDASVSTVPLRKTAQRMAGSEDYIPMELNSVKKIGDINAASKPYVPKTYQNLSSSELAASRRTYAIILSGGANKNNNNERYWNDCSFIYQTLVNRYGVPKDNIIPIMSDGNNPDEDMRLVRGGYASQNLDLDGDNEPDIELAATNDNVSSALLSLYNRMGKDDHLFFYVIDHGGSDDYISESYICLWNGGTLYDHTLAGLLEPFCQKGVNVNVVLGQCFAGGFNDDLTKVGCVVASACTGGQSSYARSDIRYDEFVYHWTSAVNGANHCGSRVNADTNGDGFVSMEEAFKYAKSNDVYTFEGSIYREEPQYTSTPLSIGEDLSFIRIPDPKDIYIKDNDEDTGVQYNISTDKSWISPSIWVRNVDDGVEEHENPYYSSDHTSAYVYVKIHNRGRENYTGGKWLHLYWGKAATAFTKDVWRGLETYNDRYVTGGRFEPVSIPPINAGDSAVIKLTWALPSMMSDMSANEKHHFCFKAKIDDSSFSYMAESDVNFNNTLKSNDVAQANVSVITNKELSKKTAVYVRNNTFSTQKYSLELRPRNGSDGVYRLLTIEMTMSDKIYNAWVKGGKRCQSVAVPSNNTSKSVQFTSPDSKLEGITLNAGEFDVVYLKITYDHAQFPTGHFTFDLIQKDENDNIVGGEVVDVSLLTIKPTDPPIIIIPGLNSDGTVTLAAQAPSYSDLAWIDGKSNLIGDTESVTVNPGVTGKTYTLLAVNDEGDMTSESINLDVLLSMKGVRYAEATQNLEVELAAPAPTGAELVIASVLDSQQQYVKAVPVGDNKVVMNVSDLNPGLFVISYIVNSQIADSKKFNK